MAGRVKFSGQLMYVNRDLEIFDGSCISDNEAAKNVPTTWQNRQIAISHQYLNRNNWFSERSSDRT